jgi:cytochrome b
LLEGDVLVETSLNSARADTQGVRVWDIPTRLFHWLLVAAIVVAFLSSDEDSALAAWHQAAGWIAGLLIVFRLVWGIVGGEHARFADFLQPGLIGAHLRGLLAGKAQPELGHNPLGAAAIVLILALVAGTVTTGVLLIRGGEDELHEAIAYGLLALAGVHVVAVLVMSLASRENLVRAMVTGSKPASRHPGAKDARPASGFALPLAALAVAAAAYGATRIDPQAFGPHASAEAGESHEGGEAAEHDVD